MAVVIITLSNKPTLLPDAKKSVRAQTRKARHVYTTDNPQWHINRENYPPAMFYNRMASQQNPEDYIMWLSDDDLLEPSAVELLAGYLDDHPEIMAVYGLAEHWIYDPDNGVNRLYRPLPRDGGATVYDRNNDPCGAIDGGQYMVRKSALDEMGYPYAPERADGSERVNDGLVMRRLASHFGIYPLQPQALVLKCRTTPLSAHSAPDPAGGVASVNWRRLDA
jgi:hypothetical protein